MHPLDSLVLWLRVARTRLGRLARKLARNEAWLLSLAVLGIMYSAAVTYSAPTLDHWLSLASATAFAVLFVYPVLADSIITREQLKAARAAVIAANISKPTGAPRVAEVTCKHGVQQRFVYGPEGWEAAGPVTEPRPTREEVSAT